MEKGKFECPKCGLKKILHLSRKDFSPNVYAFACKKCGYKGHFEIKSEINEAFDLAERAGIFSVVRIENGEKVYKVNSIVGKKSKEELMQRMIQEQERKEEQIFKNKEKKFYTAMKYLCELTHGGGAIILDLCGVFEDPGINAMVIFVGKYFGDKVDTLEQWIEQELVPRIK